MKIQTIEITDYKAFLGSHKINVRGKNLFIYGDGSGKSSLYYALKDFFQSSIEEIDIAGLEKAKPETCRHASMHLGSAPGLEISVFCSE